jgi:hypothetical protein
MEDVVIQSDRSFPVSQKRSPIPKASSDTQVMKAQIYVNRHIVAANKKATKQKGALVDERAISINTYLGSVYAKRVEYSPVG